MSPEHFMESGCAVCGELMLLTQLQKLSTLDNIDLDVLRQDKVTRNERNNANDPIAETILDYGFDSICNKCYKSMSKGKLPLLALANGKWLGDVPEQLSDLSYAEQLLIARIRHNRCIVKVSSGMRKMRANAITFANPMPKIYDKLPPHSSELDEVLAFIYTGPCKPTQSDFERTPLLVRRSKVAKALEWLILNHSDYYDVEISAENLASYPDNAPPVVVDYRHSTTNKNPESTAVNDMELEDGTESGKCPFVVHGLTGDQYSDKSTKALKAIALKHMTHGGKAMAIGHEKDPQSIYSNPQLYPQIMPWLFPYGLGGIGNDLQQGRLSDIAHKRHLLMYHDKRFQKDPHFPLIAFNHEQIKQCTTGGYLLAEKFKFENISQRLMDIDTGVLADIAKRMENGDKVTPETDEEKLCFQLIKDLDHVGSHVKGSVTNKKYMRNEIWSLISFCGAPSWFITFSPADIMHPLCLYFADTDEAFTPKLKDYAARYKLIAQNPVAGARFFHFMCEMFIKHVLGVGTNHSGIYGDTNAYYGAAEQQGRLTLHMHMLLYLKKILSPQEIRDRIMNANSEFQHKIVEYLESVHIGEFMTGTMDDVKAEADENCTHKSYADPTQTLPEAPPPFCDCGNCKTCKSLNTWWNRFKHIVDDLVLRSNVHDCGRNRSSTEKANKKDRPTCINKQGHCKARFPRPLFEQTQVDPQTCALNIKKGEAWINTFTPIVTYLLRCNSDVTSLLSGTAIKAIVAYVSDYITKPGLKTYSIFDTIRSVFDRNSEMLGGSLKRKEKARKLMTQIVNSLTAKLEIGGPMASLYLLGNPDHYTSHEFVPVYWKNYVREVLKSWTTDDSHMELHPEKVVLQKAKGVFVGVSTVYDYMYRPAIYEHVNLYEWCQMAKRVKIPIDKQPDLSEGDDELNMLDFEVKQPCKVPSVQKPDTVNLETEFDKLNIKDNEPAIEADVDDIVDDSDSDDSDSESDNESDNDLDKLFLHDHPLYQTHWVQFNERRKNVVPNFVGGSLPRRDRGDREYYCATMMTLFKPWRTGTDLKNDMHSWDETFVDHDFTQRH